MCMSSMKYTASKRRYIKPLIFFMAVILLVKKCITLKHFLIFGLHIIFYMNVKLILNATPSVNIKVPFRSVMYNI